ncbi:MAG: hypothetical protein JOZ69_25560 [Myxococcales bacterium]|nr:hypothetical protein [Myxococcales bacterium]
MNFTIPRTRVTSRVRPAVTGALAAALLSAAAAAVSPGTARAQEVRVAEPTPPAPPPPPPAPVIVQVDSDGRRAPRVITDWEEGEPIPAGYHPVTRARKGMIVAGAVPLGILYFLSALVGAVAHDANQGRDHSADGLFIPVVGPFITMTQQSSATANVFLAVDGIGQSAGLALLIYGFASPQTVLMRDQAGLAPSLVPRPMLLGRGATGLGWAGSF